MKIKRSIIIHGHKWKIMRVSEAAIVSGAIGQCLYPERIIKLLKTLKGEMLNLTLWHEIRHAQQFESGMTQILGIQAMELDAEAYASNLSSLKKQGFL